MKALLDYVSTVTDCRQEKKVRHKMMDIIMLVFFATLANADDWVEIEVFGKEHGDFLRNYLELPYGIPSHDTLQRVFAMEPSEFLENFQNRLAAVDEQAIEEKLASSEKDMNVVANETLYRVQKAVGLRK